MIEQINTFNAYLYTGTIAVIILLGGLIIGNIARKLLAKLFKEININKLAIKMEISADLSIIISTLIAYIIYIISIILFLDYLNIRLYVILLITLGILVLVGLSLLVGIKDVIPNLIGGIKSRKKIKVGKIVDMNGISGKVEKRGWFVTKVKTRSGEELHFPNQLFSTQEYVIRN
jgi:small-conductance mechanosensitive channel